MAKGQSKKKNAPVGNSFERLKKLPLYARKPNRAVYDANKNINVCHTVENIPLSDNYCLMLNESIHKWRKMRKSELLKTVQVALIAKRNITVILDSNNEPIDANQSLKDELQTYASLYENCSDEIEQLHFEIEVIRKLTEFYSVQYARMETAVYLKDLNMTREQIWALFTAKDTEADIAKREERRLKIAEANEVAESSGKDDQSDLSDYEVILAENDHEELSDQSNDDQQDNQTLLRGLETTYVSRKELGPENRLLEESETSASPAGAKPARVRRTSGGSNQGYSLADASDADADGWRMYPNGQQMRPSSKYPGIMQIRNAKKTVETVAAPAKKVKKSVTAVAAGTTSGDSERSSSDSDETLLGAVPDNNSDDEDAIHDARVARRASEDEILSKKRQSSGSWQEVPPRRLSIDETRRRKSDADIAQRLERRRVRVYDQISGHHPTADIERSEDSSEESDAEDVALKEAKRQSRNEAVSHDRRVKPHGGSNDQNERLLAALEQQSKAMQMLQNRLVDLEAQNRDRLSGNSSSLTSFLMSRGSTDIVVDKLHFETDGVGTKPWRDAMGKQIDNMESKLKDHPAWSTKEGRASRWSLLLDQSSADFCEQALGAAASNKTIDANWREVLQAGTALDFCNTLRRGLKILLPSLDLHRTNFEDAVIAFLKLRDVPRNLVDLIYLFSNIAKLSKQAGHDGDWLQPHLHDDGTINPHCVIHSNPDRPLTTDIRLDAVAKGVNQKVVRAFLSLKSFRDGNPDSSGVRIEGHYSEVDLKRCPFMCYVIKHDRQKLPNSKTMSELNLLIVHAVTKAQELYRLSSELGANYDRPPRVILAEASDSNEKVYSKRDRARSRGSGPDTDVDDAKRKRSESRSKPRDDKYCKICGRKGHNPPDCEFTKHPDANFTSAKFADSVTGKPYVKAGALEDRPTSVLKMKRMFCPKTEKLILNPNYVEPPSSSRPTAPKADAGRGNGGGSDARRGGGGGSGNRPSKGDAAVASGRYGNGCKCDSVNATNATLHCIDCDSSNNCTHCDEMSHLLAIDELIATQMSQPSKANISYKTKPLTNRRSVLIRCDKQEMRVEALVDTGCTHRNFISPGLAGWLRSVGAVRDDTSGRVCSAFGQCKELVETFVAFDVVFDDIVNNTSATITISATVLDMKNLQLVLGLPTICVHDLVRRMIMPPPLLATAKTKLTRADRHRGTGPSAEAGSPPILCHYCVRPRLSDATDPANRPSDSTLDALHAWLAVTARQVQAESEISDPPLDGQLDPTLKATTPTLKAGSMRKKEKSAKRKRATSTYEAALTDEAGACPEEAALTKLAKFGPEVALGDRRCSANIASQVIKYNTDDDSGVEIVDSAQAKQIVEGALCTLREDKSMYLDPEPDAEEIDEARVVDLFDMLPTGASSEATNELPGPEAFHGPPALQEAMKQLCAEFSDLFSTKVRTEPARVTPMEIWIDEGKEFYVPESRRSPRPQSAEKLTKLKSMITDLLRAGVIVDSSARHASQVLLVIKKNTTKLRFCVDYRELNSVTKGEERVIPNIGEMLQRLGAKRCRFFGVMDLTSGYHQAPLSERSRAYTAFTSAFGKYEWTRVVMGLKCACSHFQHMMTSDVLKGLINDICEVYLDDIITAGTSEDEFLANLRAVFLRFREKNITLNPDKCRFGLAQVEYVGHVIGQDGLTFTRDKIDSVIHFPRPKTHKQMLSFLGLANYFRQHVPNHSTVSRPMQRMTEKYKASTKLVWTKEAESAFETMKELIDKCPQLFFHDPNGQIFLQTDASNDGIGAYLFQRILQADGTFVDQPIEFISKAFSKEQKRWSTNEQEAYAIFYSCRKLDYLLRDVKFVLQTDHLNLVYVNNEASPKVKRWKLALQEYNFDIEHIPGKRNVVADAFSRMCVFDVTDADTPIEEEFLQFLEAEAEWDAEIENYDGPLFAGGVEQFFSLEVEMSEAERREAKKHSIFDLYTPPEVHELIAAAHNAYRGHAGVRRTMGRLTKQGVSFDHMRDHVEKFVKHCAFCQKTSDRKGPHIVTEPFTLASYGTMMRLNIDSIGPLTEDEEGYQHILVVVDTFTRWLMLYPLKALGAQECAQALIQHFGTFGAPAVITTDQGSQLNNSLIKQIVKLIGSQHKLTVAHSHEENSLVERANKEVGRHLRAFLFEDKLGLGWRDFLPFVQRIYNTEVIDSIGVAPARILFGGAVELDRSIFPPSKMLECDKHDDLANYTAALMKAQKATIEYASRRQLEKDKEHMSKSMCSTSSSITEFAVGAYVLVAYPDDGFLKHAGPPSKLMTKLRGPMQVQSNVGATYELTDLATGRPTKAHISRLRPFLFDKEHVDPVAVAAKDHGQWLVESILGHKNFTGTKKLNKIGKLLLHVKWIGSDELTWEPWSRRLNNNVIAIEYMRRFPFLEKHIPQHYRDAFLAEQQAVLAP